MRFSSSFAALGACCLQLSEAQQYMGDTINNSLPTVPGAEITYFRINDPSGKNSNLTMINYYSHGKSNKRLVEGNVQRAVIIVHGLNRDPGTYMSNMLSALAQTTSDPNVNFDSVAIMAPYFPNGDDKNYGYPWIDGAKPGRGSTSNALVWKGSQWSAGGDNQYPYGSTNTSSFTVLDQVIRYFDNKLLFPKMNQMIIAGHSLGAQTVQRYAAIGAPLNTQSPVNYWIANPNSYVWLSTDRPFSTASCASYDDYRDGYTNFASYPMTYATGLVAKGRAAILANFNAKAISYARGLQDLGDDSSSCAPGTTGSNRNERFFNFIKAFPPSCPDPKAHNCDTVDFINAGHDAGSMMASPAGQARLFLDNFNGTGNRSYDFGYPRQQGGDDPFSNPALNGTYSSVNNNTYAGNMTYWGCWSDQNPRSLTNLSYTGNANTIELCTSTCAAGNNSIAGLEFGSQCYCGDSLGYLATKVIESSCSFNCPGDSSQVCGGSSRLSIFSHGRPAVLEPPGTPETVGDFYYVSCYTEATNGARALVGKSTSSNAMTLSLCASTCSGYQYFGTEYGGECYCGNSFSTGANRTSDTDCNMLCSGSSKEFCGAGNRLTIYQNPDWSPSSGSPTFSSSPDTSTFGDGSGPMPSSTGISCPMSNSTTVITIGKAFLIECGIDHAGGDLTSLTVASFQQCVDTCAQSSMCVAIALSGSACYLKSSVGPSVSNGVWGARLVPVVSSTASSSFTSVTSLEVGSASGTLSSAISVSFSRVDSRTTTSILPSPTTTVVTSSLVVSTPITTTTSVGNTFVTATSTASNLDTSPGLSSSSGAVSSLSSSISSSSTASSVTSTLSTSVSPILPSSTRTSTSSSPAVGPTMSALPLGYSALGCFIDSTVSRVLPRLNSSTSLNTPQRCALGCSDLGYKYSGTEYGSECWCGHNAPSSSSFAPTSDCKAKCSGDKTQPCGASNRISIIEHVAYKPTFFARQSYQYWNVKGCYVDGPTRLLETAISLADYGGAANATVANCMESCQAKGFYYCGVEYFSECWGSNNFPQQRGHLAGDDPLNSGCNAPCKGNKTEACGGSNRVLLYEMDGGN